MSPIWACALRLVCAAVALNLLVLISGKGWPRGAALRASFWYGFWDFGVNLPLLYWGEQTVPTGLAAVVYATCPIAAMVESRLLGMELLNSKKLAAALLALAGVAVIFWQEIARGGSALGLAAIFLAACTGTLSALMLQRGPKVSPVGANAVGVLVGIPICFAVSGLLGEHWLVPTAITTMFPVLYLAIVGSVGAFVTFAWLLNVWTTTTASFIGVVVPVIAVILGSLVRREAFPLGSLVGAVIIGVAVVMALRAEAAGARRANAEPIDREVLEPAS